jgi:hypothetical protein
VEAEVPRDARVEERGREPVRDGVDRVPAVRDLMLRARERAVHAVEDGAQLEEQRRGDHAAAIAERDEVARRPREERLDEADLVRRDPRAGEPAHESRARAGSGRSGSPDRRDAPSTRRTWPPRFAAGPRRRRRLPSRYELRLGTSACMDPSPFFFLSFSPHYFNLPYFTIFYFFFHSTLFFITLCYHNFISIPFYIFFYFFSTHNLT